MSLLSKLFGNRINLPEDPHPEYYADAARKAAWERLERDREMRREKFIEAERKRLRNAAFRGSRG